MGLPLVGKGYHGNWEAHIGMRSPVSKHGMVFLVYRNDGSSKHAGRVFKHSTNFIVYRNGEERVGKLWITRILLWMKVWMSGGSRASHSVVAHSSAIMGTR